MAPWAMGMSPGRTKPGPDKQICLQIPRVQVLAVIGRSGRRLQKEQADCSGSCGIFHQHEQWRQAATRCMAHSYLTLAETVVDLVIVVHVGAGLPVPTLQLLLIR